MTYSTLIDGCVREGAIDTGKQLLTEMVGRGVKPNAVTYNTLLRAYAMDDKVDVKVRPHKGIWLSSSRLLLSATCVSESTKARSACMTETSCNYVEHAAGIEAAMERTYGSKSLAYWQAF